ncbi:hypothetical protein HID58_071769 [Brassica napus]|uniref:Uncharacterized protein n=1 Tax=Brassica napus TaxID=3708 RepID=A0ABQ7Z2J3_BRANA|nr:hypothetical protein HID58_071769 [Brassica napus]
MTNHDTFTDGFEGVGNGEWKDRVVGAVSNCLALFFGSVNDLNGVTVVNRKLLGVEETEEFPSWLKRVDRELLGTPTMAIQADITVSKDGTKKKISRLTDTHSFHLRLDAPFFPQIALITLFEVEMMRESSAQV